jgi:hypothetical protein
MSSPRHASMPGWAWAVPLLASALVALTSFHIVPSDDTNVLAATSSMPSSGAAATLSMQPKRDTLRPLRE